MRHQSALARAFMEHDQGGPGPQGGPPPLPGDEAGAQSPGPQARLQQALSPQVADTPPMPTWNRQSGVGVLPSPEQERAGFVQNFHGTDDQGKLQDFARRYGPQQAPAPPESPLGASTVPAGGSPPAGSAGETPSRTQGATDPLGPPPATAPAMPPGQGEPGSPLPMPRTGVTATGPDDTALLRNLTKAYFLAGKPQEALAIYRYSEEQAQLRNLARVYRDHGRSVCQRAPTPGGPRRPGRGPHACLESRGGHEAAHRSAAPQ